MTRSTFIKKLAVCTFTVAAFSSLAVVSGRADAQQRPFDGQAGFNAGGNLPVAGAGSVRIQDGSGNAAPGGGTNTTIVNSNKPFGGQAGFNAGGNLPVAGAGSVRLQDGRGPQVTIVDSNRPFGGQPGFNTGGNLPVGGAGAVPIQGNTQTRPFGGQPGFNAGGNLPVGGAGSVPIVTINNGGPTKPGDKDKDKPPTIHGPKGSHQPVPEPISMLGTLTASVFGARFMKKRKQMQASQATEQA